ncbi:PAS domain S-box protein [Mesorhizobium sp. SP-1A]|uniref:sensor histidine kinase n=1 Tax=Mesorhizobium sp. SP-1A TaxID=3077840 RepID=UPI0028F71B6D|nr:PAS domain S-box protein [Mesorhizobium sp. SP-1A]
MSEGRNAHANEACEAISQIEAVRNFQDLFGEQTTPAFSLPEQSSPINLDQMASYHLLLQALPAAIYTTDAKGRITFYNDAAAALWGHRPVLGTDEWCGSWKLCWPDGTALPHDECPMAMALKEGRAIHGVEAAAERPDGTRVPFLAFPTPFFGPSGEVIGAVNMLVDIAERKVAELAMQRLAAIVESSDDAILSKDLNGTIMSWNRGAQNLFGYREEEVVGKSVTMLIPADRQDEEPRILARLRRGERIDHYETVRRRKDGSFVDVSLCISPITGQNGRIIGASKIARDISGRKAADKYRDLLFREMKHRIKNTLALAASISNQTFGSATDGERETFIQRLQALGNAHDSLSKQDWEGACLTEVVTKTMAPHRTGQGRIHISGPDVTVDAGKAVAIALALHELATNAAKYGALSGTAGTVKIEWKALDAKARSIRFRWLERGGPAVGEPKHKGFGSRLIERGLAAEFDAVALEFRPRGVACTFEFSRPDPHDNAPAG